MLDLKAIEANSDAIKSNLAKRSFDTAIIDRILAYNSDRKDLLQKIESKRNEIKTMSKEIGQKKKSGENVNSLIAQVAELKSHNSDFENKINIVFEELENTLSTIPNLLAEDTPEGKDESENKEIEKWGEPKVFDFDVVDHATLGEKLGMLDFESAAKLTGSRFVVYKGQLARLERALANFMIDFHVERGYTETIPPFLVHARSMYGTGQLPKFAEDAFKIEGQDWYLIPTSEVPLTNLKRDEVFSDKELPLKYTAWTPCFRSEAGSYGKDTRGLIRMHQFSKVEMVNIVAPQDSAAAHDEMANHAREILRQLELPYRIVTLCSGDIGFSASKTYDFEVWLPSQKTYREISSVSNCTDFQARRAGIRFKKGSDKPVYAHTLNGSGLAVGRTLVALMENYQNSDGSIDLPKVLLPYMGGITKIQTQK